MQRRLAGGPKSWYTSDEAQTEVSFYYEVGKEQVIRFKNQERIVWAKDKTT
ncbi:MAG TPA: hypothetical protein VMJ35_11080 [Dongiaceae bacterium]|nr:hypothetical protein [Dongiaceae bacterium]